MFKETSLMPNSRNDVGVHRLSPLRRRSSATAFGRVVAFILLGATFAIVSSRVAAAAADEAAPRLTIVVGPQAPPLERFAAQELASQARELFGAESLIATEIPANKDALVLIGSPTTNPAVEQAMGKSWPQLSDQGHLVRSSPVAGRPAVVVGGGSPVATLWAAYEFGYYFGVRYLLHGDIYPAVKPPLKLDGIDRVLEPDLKLRTWRTVNDFPIGPESWGLADQRKLLTQLAKLKFNRVLVQVYAWQPFVDFEFGGVKKQTALQWYGYRYPVDGDTAGRAAFRGATIFENPDFAGKTSYSQRIEAGQNLVRGIIDQAHALGMTAALGLSPLEFPREFASTLPGAKVLHSLEQLVIGPGKQQPPDDPRLRALTITQLRAYIDAYPELDAIYLTLPEFPEWVEHHDQAWARLDQRTGIAKSVDMAQLTQSAKTRGLIASGDRGVQALRGNIAALDFFHTLLADAKLLTRKDGKKLDVTIVDVDSAFYPALDKLLPPGTSGLHFVDYTARRVAAHPDLLAEVPAKSIPSNLILTLADDNVGVLPQMATAHLHSLVGQLRKNGWQGYSTRYWIAGDLSPSAHYLSRASFDASVTPTATITDLIDAVSGEGVAARVLKGFQHIEQATDLIDENDIGFTFPVPGVVLKHYAATEPPPAWWAKVKTNYTQAMDEMYRGNTRARQGARPFTLYYAKRLEFAVHYMTSIEAVRNAGVAKAKGDKDAQVAELEKAIEAMYNALSAYSEVARDQSDRGVIAVLNEYGYRALQEELNKL
jgi:hypothetical protein